MKKKDLVIFGYDMIGDSNPWDAPEVELWIGEYKNSNFILDDLFDYISMVDYDGDEEEYIFSFEGEDARKWEIEKFGKSEGNIYEWTDKEIKDLIDNTLENNSCSNHDKIFLEHLISFI